MGWKAKETFNMGIVKTIGWYIQKYLQMDVKK